jgi:hypothetical protein
VAGIPPAFDHVVVLNAPVAQAKDDSAKLYLDAWTLGENYPITGSPADLGLSYYGAFVARADFWN